MGKRTNEIRYLAGFCERVWRVFDAYNASGGEGLFSEKNGVSLLNYLPGKREIDWALSRIEHYESIPGNVLCRELSYTEIRLKLLGVIENGADRKVA